MTDYKSDSEKKYSRTKLCIENKLTKNFKTYDKIGIIWKKNMQNRKIHNENKCFR